MSPTRLKAHSFRNNWKHFSGYSNPRRRHRRLGSFYVMNISAQENGSAATPPRPASPPSRPWTGCPSPPGQEEPQLPLLLLLPRARSARSRRRVECRFPPRQLAAGLRRGFRLAWKRLQCHLQPRGRFPATGERSRRAEGQFIQPTRSGNQGTQAGWALCGLGDGEVGD